MRNGLRIGAAAVVVMMACLPAKGWGRIKLITLPVRERVEIQLDNPNATLVEEERIVPLESRRVGAVLRARRAIPGRR